MPQTSANAPHLSRICLRVRDPGRSAEFYRTVLGLASGQNTGDGSGSTISVQRSANTPTGFEVVFAEGLPPGDHLTGLDRISFEAASRECVDYIYEEARKRHARATQPRLYEGHWQTFIFDPDGYKVEVFSHAQNGVVPPSGDRE
jgi:catechol 2,3-dioxygenase-like lactoylglutathione lyase family enzyme